MEKFVEGAKDGAERAAALTQRLLAFSRQQPLSPKSIDANRLISEMQEMLVRTLGERVRVETVLEEGLSPLTADPSQLENAILNLAVNARDAMADEGLLTIATANVELDDDEAQTYDIEAGHYVTVAVSDTGSGIDPSVMEKVFDPFFTTKEHGRGTGMGLSQVFGFVRQSGGHVVIDSELGQGTTVAMYLPRSDLAPEESIAGTGEGETEQGSPDVMIMVVEDDWRVLSFVGDSLRDLGYSVIEASGPAAALELIDSGRTVDMLLTDIAMPEMSGRQLARQVAKRLPDARVLFMTGYSSDTGTIGADDLTLPKPFTIDQLSKAVRWALATSV